MQKILACVIGVAAMLIAGGCYTFNVYANCIKFTFNYTQVEVDMVAAFGHVGFSFGLPAGLLHCRFGVLVLCIISFLLPTLGYLLLWSTFLSVDVYHYRPWLVAFYYFIIGHGSVYLYMASLITNIKNLPKRHRATVVGLFDAIFVVSAAIFMGVYETGFARDSWTRHEEHQNLVGFMLLMATSCAIVSFISILGLREYKKVPVELPHVVTIPDVRDLASTAYEYEDDDASDTSSTFDDDKIPIVGMRPRIRLIVDTSTSRHPSVSSLLRNEQASSPEPDPSNDLVGLKLFRRFDFHCLIWPFFLTGGACFVITSNITIILKSLNMTNCETVAILTTALVGGLARIVVGSVSDRFVERIPRANICFFCLLPFLFVVTFSIWFMDNFVVLVLLCASIGLANGALWCLVPTIISERFGMKYFGVNWGCTLLASALIGVGLQRAFGALYDEFVFRPIETLLCQGNDCFRYSFVLFSIFTICSMILIAIYCRTDATNEAEERTGAAAIN
jgi:hypothetical protein